MITNRIKRGGSGTLPNGAQGEPLFTTDTYDLYIGKGDGTNQRFQKYIASGTSTQFLKGDGSLDSTSYQTALTFSSPLVNTSGTISIPAATGSVNGYLTSTDWTTFNSKEPAITAGTTLQYYRGDKTFQTLDTSVVPENGPVYFTEPKVRATVLTGLNLSGGGTIAATDSVLTAFGKVQNQISALVGSVYYAGTWNASTNSPTLTSGTGTKGYYYIVSVAGSTNLDGITDWKIGDWAIFNGSTWDKVDNTDAVSSVNGFTGAVNLALDNISDVSAASPTNAQLLRFNGTSSLWENWTPTFEPALTKGNLTEATSSVLTITGGTGAVIGSGTTIQVAQASGSVSGYLSSTDWTTFNNKQNALTNPVTGTGTTNTLPKFTGTSAIGNSLLFDNGTNVLINNTTVLDTAVRLQVTSSSSGVTSFSSLADDVIFEHNTNLGLTFATPNTAIATIGFADPESNLAGSIQYSHVDNSMAFATDSAERMRITSGGQVRAGTESASDRTSNRVQLSAADENILSIQQPVNTVGAKSSLSFYNRNSNNAAVIYAKINSEIKTNNAGNHTGDLIFSTVNAGALGERMRISSTGAATFSSSISATSATFSGNVTVDTNTLYVDSTNNRVGIGTSTPSARLTVNGTGVNSAIDWINTTATTGRTFRWVSLNAGGFAIEDITASATRFTIASTGAATFSSTISATTANFNGFGINSNPTSLGTSQSFVRFLNTGGDFYVGLESSTNGGFFTGSTAYDSVLYSNTPLNFIISNVSRLRIASTGAATFSSSISATSATFSGNVTVGTGVINANIGGDLSITQGAIGLRINDAASAISPTTATVNNDNAVDLGVSNIRFRNMYLAGTLTNNGTGGISIDTSGNVGIGVTPSAWGTGNSVRAIQLNSGAIWSFSTTSLNIIQNAYFNGTSYIYSTTAAATRFESGGGGFTFRVAPSGTAGTAATFSTALTIENTGAAIFSSNVTINGGNYLKLNESTNTNHWQLYTYTDNSFRMNYNGAGNDEFIMSSTGAATFSSTASFGGNVTLSGGSDLIITPATSGVNATLYNDIGKLVSTASLVVQGTGEFSSSITTGAPSGGTAKPWKFGNRIAATNCYLNSSQYIELEVDGTTYKLATIVIL